MAAPASPAPLTPNGFRPTLPAWLPALVVVALIHAAIWQSYSPLTAPPTPLNITPPSVEVTLATPAPPTESPSPGSSSAPAVAPRPLAQPPAESPVPPTAMPPAASPAPAAVSAPATISEAPVPAQTPAPLMAPTTIAPARETTAIAPASAPAAPAVATTKPAPEPAYEPARYTGAGLNNPKASYPLMAKKRGLEGIVLVRAEVLPDGRCGPVSIKRSSGYDVLDRAALEAVAAWRFTPARRGDQAIAAALEIPIQFKLNE